MTAEETVYKLLGRAILEIRVAAVEKNRDVVFHLADLFHNVPAYLEMVRRGEKKFEDIIELLKSKSEQKNMLRWLEHSLNEIQRHRTESKLFE